MSIDIKKKRSSAERLFARYKTYEGERGSPEQWRAEAREMAVRFSSPNNLSLLGLESIPTSLDELKAARRKAMMTAHPDRGGNADDAARINAAYSSLEHLVHRPLPKWHGTPIGLVDPPRCTGSLPTNLDDPNWVFELKMDGWRFQYYIGFDPYGRNPLANTLLSRYKGNDGRYTDRSENVPHLTSVSYSGHEKTVLDGECFHTDLDTTASIMGSTPHEAEEKQRTLGPATFWAFDISFHRGVDVRHRPLSERRELLLLVLAELNNPHVKAMPQYKGDIQAKFDEVTARGGEGLVGKRLNSTYGQGWAKMKKAYDVSCIITGYRPGQKALEGQVGSVALSVYKDGQLVEIGFASGMINAVREAMTADFNSYLGRVVDVFCHEVTKDGKLRSPTWHRLRPDVNAEECTIEKLRGDMSKTRSNRNKG